MSESNFRVFVILAVIVSVLNLLAIAVILLQGVHP